ncbi:phosphoenolpyruvate--protein phosphotransferase [Microbacterium sp.]|uniref:phosphoenolpyruvate--protein phosphotransferase n=1 Tax=Microbacterium sp. TaxID=51671 RepID=UPI003A92EAFD
MVGIVVVSHSPALAEAAVRLALEMVADAPPRIVIAAGTDDGRTGTDAVRVAEAIGEADDGSGVVVLMDLGSAVLSAELALELLPQPVQTRLVAAPFVEGLLAAAVRAAGGAELDEVAQEAATALSAKTSQLGPAVDDSPPTRPPRSPVEPASPDQSPQGTATEHAVLVNAAGLHARPAALLAATAGRFHADTRVSVRDEESVPALSPTGLATLGARTGDTVTVTARGPEATAAVEAVIALIESGFGEDAGVPTPVVRSELGGNRPHDAVPEGGRGVSPGRVVGTIARMPDLVTEPDPDARIEKSGRDEAVRRLWDASARVAAHLQARARAHDGPAREILAATEAMAADPVVIGRAAATVREDGVAPERAAWAVFSEIADQLLALGGLQAERASDVHNIRGRIVAALTGRAAPGVPERDHPFVLVATDLAPADTAELTPERCLAIVTAEGGPTSHTAILARSLGIPAVVAFARAGDLVDGMTVLVDGATGEVIIDPTPAQIATAAPPVTAPHGTADPPTTSDGTAVSLLANIGEPSDVPAAVGSGASGVGLFRTEFAFLGRTEQPDVDEQARVYGAVLTGFCGQRVIVRTLDAGSDKPLPFLSPHSEPNPALGVRGLRTALTHPEVLDRQLRAIAHAIRDAAATCPQPPDVGVMAPMVATTDEAEQFATRARAAGITRVGIMIETPAAALLSDELLTHVDFASIGTNDLAQYTLAADRTVGALADLNDPWQPAVLRLIETAAQAGVRAGKPVGVCGEAAADPLLACVLLGMGATSLSMTARMIPAVAAAVRAVSHVACVRAAAASIAADSAVHARDAARAALAG